MKTRKGFKEKSFPIHPSALIRIKNVKFRRLRKNPL